MDIKTRIPRSLVEELENIFKPRRHSSAETYPEIMEHSGRLEVIEFIRSNYERQQENILHDPLLR